MKNISEFLLDLPNLFYYSSNISPLNISKSLNFRTNVLSITVNSIDSLHDILFLNFLSLEFQTRKIVDFLYWALVLFMHKFGYFYLPEGRKLEVKFSNYMNKSRNRNSGKNLSIPEIKSSLFDSPFPVNLEPYMSLLAFAQTFSKLQNKNLIWVYDKDILVEGSPFYSLSDAAESIGLKRTSSIIKRYLDTDKIYLNRYTISSSPKTD